MMRKMREVVTCKLLSVTIVKSLTMKQIDILISGIANIIL